MSDLVSWNSPIDQLFSKNSKNLSYLLDAGYAKISDLLWIFPLKLDYIPHPAPFSHALPGEIFRGQGKIVNIQQKPSNRIKPKGKAPLQNITVYTKDLNSDNLMQLKFFNTYPSITYKLESLEIIDFYGTLQIFNNEKQIINPTFENENKIQTHLDITYPVINRVKGHYIKAVMKKIPQLLWDQLEEYLPKDILKENKMLSLSESYRYVHGRNKADNFDKIILEQAKERLIYEEFFQEQLKILARKKLATTELSNTISICDREYSKLLSLFPYELTPDQKNVTNEIRENLTNTTPMMRLIQGDVGSGKTSVAILASIMTISSGFQAALMCPTEALARQHFQSIKNLLKASYPNIKIDLLTGSTKPKEKKIISENLSTGEIHFIIGTHSLIQDSVNFKNLSLAIIDEQHKFGVQQRIKLSKKNQGINVLIMTATPIPRSLSLTQYGDLDISLIKSMPKNRKEIKTKIVTPKNFEKFLSFLKTRVEMGEQAYVVVPAIFDNEDQNFIALEKAYKQFNHFFPNFKIEQLHGQLKSDEKECIFKSFTQGDIQILIATSVIEVGIDVHNATIMAILNPERFGLSSLHQLRGRIGRGEKPGFCFLIVESQLNPVSLTRTKIIENNLNGFIIAEEDLKIRGEGNLFGQEQSGENGGRRLANIVIHGHILQSARQDLYRLVSQNHPKIMEKILQFNKDPHIFTTI